VLPLAAGAAAVPPAAIFVARDDFGYHEWHATQAVPPAATLVARDDFGYHEWHATQAVPPVGVGLLVVTVMPGINSPCGATTGVAGRCRCCSVRPGSSPCTRWWVRSTAGSTVRRIPPVPLWLPLP
jgi:hypothetical protein